jgi:hypothetical protein
MKNGPYILLKAPEEYPGLKYRNRYVYEHHLKWWQATKSLVPRGYTIHHRNGSKTDNNIENLEIIHKSTHVKIHKAKKEWKLLICNFCKKPFIRAANQCKFKIKEGQKNFYCCREHVYKFLRE